MGKMLFVSMKLAFAMVCVGASLILGAQWLGIIPDQSRELMRSRHALSEAVAINASSHVRKQQWLDLQTTLQTLVDRDPDILSIGLRTDLGGLRSETKSHNQLWSSQDMKDAGIEIIEVPISSNLQPWGTVELTFRQENMTLWSQLQNLPVFHLLLFFCLAGLVAYTAFMMRVLKLFNNTQVVPDRVRQALDTLTEGLLVLDESGRIVLANSAFAKIIGKQQDELEGVQASELSWVAADIVEGNFPWRLAIDESVVQTERILRYQLGNGPQRIFSANAAPLGKKRGQRGALATFRDVTHLEEHRAELERMLGLLRNNRDEVRRKNRELEILATQDALTGCLNRRSFFEAFESLWTESQALGTKLSCVMIDIDHFKMVNDTYGHNSGDEVLRRVAQKLREIFKSRGMVCRYGGEEFCAVLPQFGLEEAIALAEKTRIAISEIRLLDPAELRLTVSIGVSELRFTPVDTQDLIHQADKALYVAKREGRNRIICYNYGFAEDTVVWY